MLHRYAALLLLCLSHVAAAQTSGDDLLSRWWEAWADAARDVEAVVVRETLDRTVDGPRGEIEMRTESTLTYSRDGATDRDVDRALLDGRPVGPLARRRFETRTDRAFGSGADALLRPALLPGILLADASATGAASPARLDGRPALRVPIRLPAGRGLAWFSRDESPRLLRLRLMAALPGRARVVTEADYRTAGGLDVPTDLRTTVTLRQRRRLRDYVVTLHARGTYRAPRIVRR